MRTNDDGGSYDFPAATPFPRSAWMSTRALNTVIRLVAQRDGGTTLTTADLVDRLSAKQLARGGYVCNVADKLYLHTNLSRADAEDLIIDVLS